MGVTRVISVIIVGNIDAKFCKDFVKPCDQCKNMLLIDNN